MGDINQTLFTLITPVNILILFGISVIASLLFTYFYKSYDSYDKSRSHIFFTMMVSFLAVFVVLFNMLLAYSIMMQTQISVIEQSGNVSQIVLYQLENYIAENANKLPMFVKSISPLVVLSSDGEVDESTVQAQRLKQSMSMKIISVWMYLYNASKFTVFDPRSYVYYLLQYCNSQEFYEIYQVLKYNYNKEIVQIGDILFKYSLPIENQTVESYLQATEEVISDPKFKSIFGF